jgi:Spy/CpxP family protein refolding chaperone
MKIRSILVGLLAVGLVSSFAWAAAEPNAPKAKQIQKHERHANKEQAGKGDDKGEVRRGEAGQRMAKELGLTEEQQAQMKAIRGKYAPQMKAIAQDPNIAPAQKREKMEPLQTQMKDEIDKILTPEQKVKMEQLRKERGERMKPRGEKPKAAK